MPERVVQGAEAAGERDLAGAAAQRLAHRELPVGHVLAHWVTEELDPVGAQPRRVALAERIEVADDGVRGDADAEENAGASVGGQHDVGALRECAVPAGVAVLAVEEDGGERATRSLGAGVGRAHPVARRSSGYAAS